MVRISKSMVVVEKKDEIYIDNFFKKFKHNLKIVKIKYVKKEDIEIKN